MPLHTLPILKTPFQRVAMDIFGPLKRTPSGNKYILVVMDYSTKWPEAFALKNTTAETVVDCLIVLTARVGVPNELLTDNGTNFMSKVVKQFCQTTGIRQIKTSTYHPQTDGMVERFNATFKRLLWKLTQDLRVEWDKYLPFVLWAYRGTVHSATGFSPFHLLFGRKIHMPLDELTRYWRGKEENSTVDVAEHIQVMQVNMELVREVAYHKETKKRSPRRLSMTKRQLRECLTLGTFFGCQT